MSPSRFEKTLIRTTPNRGRPKLMPKLFSTLLVAVKIGLSWKKMVRSIRFISVGIKEHTHMGASINFDKRITDWFLFCIASYRERSVFCDSLISGFKLLLRKKKCNREVELLTMCLLGLLAPSRYFIKRRKERRTRSFLSRTLTW